MVDMRSLVGNLMYTGLSEYEARVYVAFLKKSPATAYEAAREAGVPTSKVYETVARLEQKGVLTPFGDEEARSRRYVPQSAEEYMHTSRQIMDRTLEVLGREFQEIRTQTPVSFIWNISEYDALMDRVRRMVLKSERTLLISLWREEADRIGGLIGEASARGVRTACVHYGQPGIDAGQVFMHPIGKTLYDEKGGRSIVVVSDSGEAVIGTVKEDGSAEGAYSSGRGFVDLAEDYVKHDIYMMKVISRFDPHLKERFGPRYEMLRDVFSDRETL
jgi:sugar-specific transcriptional regulator TrmB